jgi:hypothetical protein
MQLSRHVSFHSISLVLRKTGQLNKSNCRIYKYILEPSNYSNTCFRLDSRFTYEQAISTRFNNNDFKSPSDKKNSDRSFKTKTLKREDSEEILRKRICRLPLRALHADVGSLRFWLGQHDLHQTFPVAVLIRFLVQVHVCARARAHVRVQI